MCLLKIDFKNQTISFVSFPKRITILSFLFFASLSSAQQAVTPAGGNATGSSGNSSFTIGQVAYTTNGNANYSVADGVQQPFEISILSGQAVRS